MAAALFVAEPPARYAMLPPLVVDCSVLCAVLFQEVERDEAVARLAGNDLHAPTLIDYEVASVALKKLRQGRRGDIENGLAQFSAVPLTVHGINRPQTLALAERYALSAYDAAYLWLAADLKSPLVTFDRRLGAAAQQHLSTLDEDPAP